MSDVNVELDRIINDGKVNTTTAIVVFAVEIKAMQQELKAVKNALESDDKRYESQSDHAKDHDGHEKRIGRLENAVIAFLVFVFLAVLGALLALVLKQGGQP